MFRECAHGKVFGMGCDICVAKTSDPLPMTDQPKPRLRGPLNPAEYQGLTYLSDASSRIALDLNSDLLNALAEVERLKADNTKCRIANTALQSSVAQLRTRVKELEGALEFYAVKRLYTNIGVQSDLYEDQGDRARQALANSRKGEADPSG